MYDYGEVEVRIENEVVKIEKDTNKIVRAPFKHVVYMTLNDVPKLRREIDKFEARRKRRKRRAKHSVLFISSVGMIFVLARFFEVDAFVRGSEIVLGALTHFIFHQATEGIGEDDSKEKK